MFGNRASRYRHNDNEPMYINPLSQRRRSLRRCEVCDKPAYMYCRHCQKAFYCSKKHLEDDKDAVHGTLCDHVRNLNSNIMPNMSNADRSRLIVAQAIIRNEISDLCLDMARDAISTAQYDVASYRVKMARKYCSREKKHEPKFMSVLAIEIENLVAQGKIGCAGTTMAAMAFMYNRRKGDISEDVKIILYRSEGIYHLATDNIAEAIDCFSNMIYSGAVYNKDPESCDCAEGMFYLGQAFLKKGNYEIAWSYYIHAANIWDSVFSRMFHDLTTRNNQSKLVDIPSMNQTVDYFPQYGRLKAVRALRRIITDNEEFDLAEYGSEESRTAMCCMYRSLATAYLLDRRWTKAGKLARMALNKNVGDKLSMAILKQARRVFWSMSSPKTLGGMQLTEKEMDAWPAGDLTPIKATSEVNLVVTRSFMQFKEDLMTSSETDQSRIKDATGFTFQQPLLSAAGSQSCLMLRQRSATLATSEPPGERSDI